MKPNIELREVRDFGELINDTFLFVRQNLKPLCRAFIVICGFFLLANIVTSVMYQMRLADVINTGQSIGRRPRFFGYEYFLSILFMLITYTAISVTTLSYMSLYREKGNQAPSVVEVWGYFKYFFLRLFGAGLVLGILGIIGFTLCIIPGIYLWPILMMILAIMVLENGSLVYAFDRGFKLVKNHWWTTFGALFIVYIVVYAIIAALTLPITVFATGSLFLVKSKMPLPLLVISTIIQSASQLFLMLPSVVMVLSYYSLTEVKEGMGLIDRIDRIGKDDSISDLPEEQY